MKELVQIAIIIIVIWGCILASGIFAWIVGSAAAAWFLLSAHKEYKDERSKGS